MARLFNIFDDLGAVIVGGSLPGVGTALRLTIIAIVVMRGLADTVTMWLVDLGVILVIGRFSCTVSTWGTRASMAIVLFMDGGAFLGTSFIVIAGCLTPVHPSRIRHIAAFRR